MYWKRRQTRLKPENRIRELDAARGFCILAMVAVHLIYDLTELYPVLKLPNPRLYLTVKNWGGIAFFLISGMTATLGHRHLRRGLTVFGCGILVSAVTGFAGMPVRFGVLQSLGCCMLLWYFFKGASPGRLLAVGIAMAATGFLFAGITVRAAFLYPLGLTAPTFSSADFFPLLPYFGYFLLGAACGKRFYRDKISLFPNSPHFSFLRFCGRHSLWIYLLHQPVLYAICASVASIY